MKKNPLEELINFLKYRFNLDEDKAAETEIVENIKKGVEFKGINLWTLIFAILIASIGLNVNSTAVIIGAMLISPLMGPIMGIGLGAGIYDLKLIISAAKNLAIASIIGLLASTVYFLISPLHIAQSELLARTTPTIWDVLIAFFGGLSGIVASSRTKYNNVIPGVAIATALMPPLCTAGFGLATMQWSFFFGAFYLYLINSVFISISTFLIVRFLKFKSISHVNEEISIKIKKYVGAIALLTVIPSIYLAYLFVQDEIFKQNANTFISTEISSNVGLTLINAKINTENKEVTITIMDNDKVDSLKEILEIKKELYDLKYAKLVINSNNNQRRSHNLVSLSDLKDGLVDDIFQKQEALINQKNEEINSLKLFYDEQNKFQEKKNEAIQEFYTLYGVPDELIIDKSIIHNPNSKDTMLFVFIKSGKNIVRNSDIKHIENWLKTKFSVDTIRIINN